MQASDSPALQSAINVTPLVDVVLVLLIIFMVIAPQLRAGPPIELPETERPPQRTDDGRHLLVAVEHGGAVWLDGQPVGAEEFRQRLAEIAERRPNRRVVIQGDARLTFGEVKRVLSAVDAAGLADVGLIAEREGASGMER